jgi:rhodanese-related sulfurtransferase
MKGSKILIRYSKTTFILVLVAILLLGTFISCNGTSNPPNTSGNTDVTQTSTTGSISGSAAFEMIRQAADTYLSTGKELEVISAEDLYTNLTDGNASNDPFILSVRTPKLYRTGHVCSAINIPLRSLFLTTSWEQLPPKDTNLIMYSETGNEAPEAIALLNMLGWDIIQMKWGFTSWYK